MKSILKSFFDNQLLNKLEKIDDHIFVHDRNPKTIEEKKISKKEKKTILSVGASNCLHEKLIFFYYTNEYALEI